MGLINYKDIDFNKSIDKENKVINFNGSEIQIVPYLSINDKYDFVMLTLQKSLENGVYNEVKMDMYFDLNLVYLYTNIVFSIDDRADEAELFDTLAASGLISIVKENINSAEISWLQNKVKEMEKKMTQYKGNLLHFLSDLIENLPTKAQEALTLLQKADLNPEMLKMLMGSFQTVKE